MSRITVPKWVFKQHFQSAQWLHKFILFNNQILIFLSRNDFTHSVSGIRAVFVINRRFKRQEMKRCYHKETITPGTGITTPENQNQSWCHNHIYIWTFIWKISRKSLEVTKLYHISYNMGVCLNFRIYRQVCQLDLGANEQLVAVKKKGLSINTCAGTLSKWF